MRRQARRLWFGDWQRDEAPAPPPPVAADPSQTDTFVILPADDVGAEPGEDRRKVQRRVAALAAFALFGALCIAVFVGGNDKPRASEQSQLPQAQAPQTQIPAQPQLPQGQAPQGFGAPDLTGADATKAAEAAVAKYPGDVERVTPGPGGGGYVVHVIQPDGNEVHVLVDGQFKVQGSDAYSGPRNVAPGTPQ